MHPKIEAAFELMGRGDVQAAERMLETVLKEPSLTPTDRALAFARLSSCYRLAGNRADALRTARDASVIAMVSDDERTRALADFMLGNAASAVFFHDNPADQLFAEAMQALERAAEGYQRLGAIDFASVVLTMAELARGVQHLDGAWPLYVRVANELADPRWTSDPSLAHHASQVRGRAFTGLGAIELARGRRAEAKAQFEMAVSLLLAGRDPSAAPILDEVAAGFDQLGDPPAAARVRAAARAL